MSGSLPMSWFQEKRPANGDGYEIGEEVMYPKRKPEVVLVRKENAQLCEYDPLNEETGLFRIFADVDPTPAGCLAFANAYGSLGSRATCFPFRPSETRHPWVTGDRYELVSVWQALI